MTEQTDSLLGLINGYNQSGAGVITIRENEPLALHSSFRIGGPADLFALPDGEGSLIALLGMIKKSGARAYFLGNGTNVLFSDEGYRGVVVSLAGLNEVNTDGDTVISGAGASLTTVCKTARDASLTGLETAYGIPGSVGGAVYMNAGAYGGQIADVLLTSRYIDLDDLTVHELPLSEHCFGYRDSIYKHTDRVIISATFALRRGNCAEISGSMNTIMKKRVDKQPLDKPSAGSVFKRPEGYFAGQLIEESGLKGFSIGGAQVSEKHAGFIVNMGGATARDVLALVDHIKETVYKNYGVTLECEIIRIEP